MQIGDTVLIYVYLPYSGPDCWEDEYADCINK